MSQASLDEDLKLNFAWVQRNEEFSDDRFDVYVGTQDLPKEAWIEYNRIVSAVAQLRPFTIDFVSVQGDLQDFYEVEEKVISRSSSSPLLGAWFTGRGTSLNCSNLSFEPGALCQN